MYNSYSARSIGTFLREHYRSFLREDASKLNDYFLQGFVCHPHKLLLLHCEVQSLTAL